MIAVLCARHKVLFVGQLPGRHMSFSMSQRAGVVPDWESQLRIKGKSWEWHYQCDGGGVAPFARRVQGSNCLLTKGFFRCSSVLPGAGLYIGTFEYTLDPVITSTPVHVPLKKEGRTGQSSGAREREKGPLIVKAKKRTNA